MAADEDKSRSELLDELRQARRLLGELNRGDHKISDSEERFRSLVENSPDFIYMADADGTVLFINRTLPQHAKKQVVGMTIYDFALPEYHAVMRSTVSEVFASGETGVYLSRAPGPDDATSTYETRCSPLMRDGMVESIIGVSTDVTERMRAEEKLRKLAAVVRYSGELVNLSTMQGEMVFLNEAGGKMLGLDPNAIEHVNIMQVIPDHFVELVETDLLPTLMRGEIWEGDLQYKNLNTGQLTDVHAMTFTVKDPSTGQPTFLANVSMDITERKRAEQERLSLERQVQQAQKLESLGVLAGGIAHDFNNLLVGILGNAELASLSLAAEDPARERILDIELAAKRAAELTSQMLAYSGRGHFIIADIHLQAVVEEMVHLLEISISKKATIKCDFADDVPAVEADATQLCQVVMNLVLNASESLGKRSGIISIRTGAINCDRAFLEETYLDDELQEGTYAFFEVSDTGYGMDGQTLAKIFDPFFTTKFTGRGLGLAAVLGIVRGHKGAIKVYSEPAKGTTFKVLLPASSGSADTGDSPHLDTSDVVIEGKRVLLVDDEESIRDVGCRMLKHLGAEVTTASDGREALNLFEADPDSYDCVILDLTMPKMDGEESFREMRSIRADVRVVLSSGYSQQDLMARFSNKGFSSFIQKPYQIAGLLEALSKAFGSVD